MSDDNVIPRAECIAAARAVLDRARARRAADRAAGRLSPEHELICRRLEAEQREREAVRANATREAARIWRHGMDAMDRMSVADAARACYESGGPSLADLEQRIRDDRAARTILPRTTAPQQRGDEIEQLSDGVADEHPHL
ncbi:hypothetical protein [Streptomyces antibioticus]|uniref:Uncharacterized protein n=1 Tax=Streptomyces antibioticus TaxID=1890 RepID=A0AAE6Y311_STRAT|nr:hypothetical protein [Streptomyces antibioticus]QIT42116.1 hypothetical protein HCX60_19040 [Streptomyces antibioticus]